MPCFCSLPTIPSPQRRILKRSGKVPCIYYTFSSVKQLYDSPTPLKKKRSTNFYGSCIEWWKTIKMAHRIAAAALPSKVYNLRLTYYALLITAIYWLACCTVHIALADLFFGMNAIIFQSKCTIIVLKCFLSLLLIC